MFSTPELNNTPVGLFDYGTIKYIKMKTLFFISLFTLSAFSGFGQEKYTADVNKTVLSWLGEKVTGEHTGTINLKSGSLNWDGTKILSGEFVIDMTSLVDADNSASLITHLKSDDFFGVEKFPTATIVITGSDSFDKGSASVRGNLTIKGTTQPVEFKATIKKDPDGMWFYSVVIVDRTKFNVRYGSGSFFDNLGDKTIYDEFKLKVTLFVKK
jgi:polyisoprenoid-binding protein YceI